jgi:hypothetical protein
MKKNLTIQEINNTDDPVLAILKIKTLKSKHANRENSVSMFAQSEEKEEQPLVEKRRIIDTLDKWKLIFDRVSARYKKSRLFEFVGKKLSLEQQKCENKTNHKLFSVVTYGSSSWDRLVFTVMAENDVWAEEMVHQWLHSNGRENHKIDRVMAVVSSDVRAIVNVGAKLVNA